MIGVSTRTLSTVEFLELSETENLHNSLELICGEVVAMPKPSWEHNRKILGLGTVLVPYLRTNQKGEISTDCLVVLDEPAGVVLAPDVVYLATEKLGLIREGRVYGTPDLVVEVLSPSTAVYDRGRKLQLYHRYQVPWVWLISVDPLYLEEYQWSEAGYIQRQMVAGNEPFTPTLFPDLTFQLSAL